MSASDVIIRPLEIERDAERLAAMWNESDLQWPSSWSRGVPITADMVREWDNEERTLIVFVAEVDGAIAGYCSFMPTESDSEAYLELLNVSPRFQKRSIGRRLIQATIDYAVEKGLQRQTLHTWSANFKAVPTYKKTGHFWTPDHWVWMQNYIPGALQMPLAKPFFERHDWYATQVRELTQDEDDERWEGLKVFTQRWQADGEALTIWIDREARAPVAIETDALQAAAIVEEIEPVAGESVSLRWRIMNKTSESLQVFLHALGDKGLSIDHRDAFVVPAGQTVERAATVSVAEDAPAKKDDGTAPAVRSILRLNGQEAELFSGLRAKKPLSLNTAPAQVSVAPGATSEVSLQLHNERKRPMTVSIQLTPPEGLDVDWTQKTLELPAKGHVALPLSVTAREEGVYDLHVHVADSEGQVKPLNEAISIFGLGPGGLLAHHAGKMVRIETDELRVTAQSEDGILKVEHKDSRLTMATLQPYLGPPYYFAGSDKVAYDLKVEQLKSRMVVRMVAEAKHYAGLFLHEELSLSSGGIASLRCYLENRGTQIHSPRLRVVVGTANPDGEWLTVPLQEGLIHCRRTEYPAVLEDLPRDPQAYVEPWMAWERHGVVAGVAWNASLADIWVNWQNELTTGELTLKPGERSADTCLLLYCASGDWERMRESALRWTGKWQPDPTDKTEHPSVRPLSLARIEPELVVTLDEQVDARLIVDTVAKRPTDGRVTLETEPDLTADCQRVDVQALRHGSEIVRDITFSLPHHRMGVFGGEARLSLDLCRETHPFHVARLGSRAPVEVREDSLSGQRIWRIHNGASEMLIAPDFGPSMIAWNQAGENQLWSAFPEPQGFAWHYPWFGGIHARMLPPGSHLWHGVLHQESFSGQEITVEDARGIAWCGVRLSTRPEREALQDLWVELDWTTLGESNLLRYVFRVRNLRETEQATIVRTSVACRLGAEATALTLYGDGVQHRPKPWGMDIVDEPWGALTNERTGKTMCLVGAQHDIALSNAGQWGRLLGSGQELRLSGGQTRELVYYLVLADSLDEAIRYRVLQDY